MSKFGPPLKMCPRCRLAMQASRSEPRGAFDTFACLRCDLVLTYKAGHADRDDMDSKE
jgi:hypothetical protein